MKSLIGTWVLVQATAKNSEGRPCQHQPYGGAGIGSVTFTSSRMVVAISDGRPFALVEGRGLTREFNSYCGEYSFDGNSLVTRVDGCTSPALIGTEQVRHAVFLDDHRMALYPPPRATGEEQQFRELVWKKVSE